MNDFRVKFKLDNQTAELFEGVSNKPEIIAEALKWYLSYGKESKKMLEHIVAILESGNLIVKESEAVEIKRDEIDDAFDSFTFS